MCRVAISHQQVRIVSQRASIWKPHHQIIRPQLDGVALGPLQGRRLQRSVPEKPTPPQSLQHVKRLVLLLMSPTNTPQQTRPVLQEQQVNGSCHRDMNWPRCMTTRMQLVVLPLTAIGVLLRTTRTSRFFSISASGVSTATTARSTPTTCVQCGLFDLLIYFSI